MYLSFPLILLVFDEREVFLLKQILEVWKVGYFNLELDNFRLYFIDDFCLKVVEFSTTKTKPFLSGSTKKTNSESFLCNKDLMSKKYSTDFPVESKLLKNQSSRLRRRSSCSTSDTVTSTPVQLT